MGNNSLRIGIDLGGTKISALALDEAGREVRRIKTNTPRGDYAATIHEILSLVTALAAHGQGSHSVGIGIPGSMSPATGLVQNANSTWLNVRPLKSDIEEALGQPVRIANDANCFTISEATDGAGAGFTSVLGVILGTGCGGGLVTGGMLVDGPRGTGGEWGHNPLPAPQADELPGQECWCGRTGCLETWVSGPGLAADYARVSGQTIDVHEILRLAGDGCEDAGRTLQRHAERLARGLAGVVNVIDPGCIVMGGGLSNMAHLYADLPELMAPHIFADDTTVRVLPPVHGDDSGVRGAAWLWGGQPDA